MKGNNLHFDTYISFTVVFDNNGNNNNDDDDDDDDDDDNVNNTCKLIIMATTTFLEKTIESCIVVYRTTRTTRQSLREKGGCKQSITSRSMWPHRSQIKFSELKSKRDP